MAGYIDKSDFIAMTKMFHPDDIEDF